MITELLSKRLLRLRAARGRVRVELPAVEREPGLWVRVWQGEELRGRVWVNGVAGPDVDVDPWAGLFVAGVPGPPCAAGRPAGG